MRKKAICASMILGWLGWLPTLAIVSGAKWVTAIPLLAQGRAPVKITRLYTGPDGRTKVEEFEVPLKAQGRGTELADIVTATGIQFRRTNQDYLLDWHPASNRQFVLTLSGESEVELDDGKKITLGPGNILLAEDTTGKGHISRAVGSQERVSVFVTLPPDAKVPRP